jgi:2-dehydro-3-deoxyphosphogluconate aldolase/(4S)-4-hydroxy-2-oxoglutarate aldolase
VTVFDAIHENGLVPVVTVDRAADAEPLGRALLAGGLPCAEITFRTGAAAAVIEVLTRTFPEMLVGAGTVLTVQQAAAAVDAGSRFVVSPGFDRSVVDWCLAQRVPVAPGVMTATEITRAVNTGLDFLKFFPAEAAGGVETLRAMASVFEGVRFMPTGGISSRNLADYLTLPMVSACGGSWLAPSTLLDNGDFTEITRRAAAAVEIVRRVRAGE